MKKVKRNPITEEKARIVHHYFATSQNPILLAKFREVPYQLKVQRQQQVACSSKK